MALPLKPEVIDSGWNPRVEAESEAEHRGSDPERDDLGERIQNGLPLPGGRPARHRVHRPGWMFVRIADQQGRRNVMMASVLLMRFLRPQ